MELVSLNLITMTVPVFETISINERKRRFNVLKELWGFNLVTFIESVIKPDLRDYFMSVATDLKENIPMFNEIDDMVFEIFHIDMDELEYETYKELVKEKAVEFYDVVSLFNECTVDSLHY